MATSSLRQINYDQIMCPNSSFPNSFKDFFHTLNEDESDIISTMLEDKLIPRSDTSSESGQSNQEKIRQYRRGMSCRHYKRRSSEHHSSRRKQNSLPSQASDIPMQLPPISPSVNRRRSSSLAVTRQPPDLHRFLQTEQNRQWSRLSTGSPPRIHLSPNHNSSFTHPTSPVFGNRRLSPGTPGSREPTSPRRGHTPTLGEIGHQSSRTRNRTSSMPAVPRRVPLGETRRGGLPGANSEENVEYYRCRSFSITANGIYNLGDSLKSRRSRSNNSVTSTGTSCSGTSASRSRNHSNASQTSNASQLDEPDTEVQTYKVGMLGAAGVGKTTLTYQFTTSEYICAYDASLDEEYGQKTVSVMLDGQETELEIIDHPACEMSVESFCATYNVDVFVVVYSIVDRKTFKIAEEILLYLWKSDYMASKAVILVGNIADLERKREVPMVVGRRLANSCGCKFIETSSGLDHNVDELLVGILAQVKLNPKRSRERLARKRKNHGGSGRRILKHLLTSLKRKSKSCENLLIL